jgi:spore germination cell wall hydrolase CwlJ-like protein
MISEFMCLAMALYYETRGEPNLDAGIAVAEVIINRVDDARWPDTVCAVVKQDKGPKPYDCQFSFFCDGRPENPKHKASWERAQADAKRALQGELLGHQALYYHADYASPAWRKQLELVGKVGTHIFYTDKPRGASV